MGVRSTLCSDHYGGQIPEWFKKKYEERLLFPSGSLIVSKTEWINGFCDDLLWKDYQRVCNEIGLLDYEDAVVLVCVLSESGNVLLVSIFKDEIKSQLIYN